MHAAPAALLALALAACGGDSASDAAPQATETPPETTTTESAGVASPSDTETQTPLDGAWLSTLTTEQVAKHLEATGLGKWTQKFLVGEEFLEDVPNQTVYTFEDGYFQVAYYVPDNAWHVGWKGPFEVDGRTVAIVDDFSNITDVYQWKVSGDRLTLTFKKADATPLDGMPYEVYSVGYLSDPLQRTDCLLEYGEPC